MRRTSGNKEKKVNSSEINKGDLRLDMDSRRLFILGREVNLTAKEFDLLELLVKNENKVYSRDDLLGLVWGKDLYRGVWFGISYRSNCKVYY